MQTNKGIYTIILYVEQNTTIHTGGLGKIAYVRGCYAYTGSARSKSGFSRIRRHINVAKGINKTRHWHIDYLLPSATLKAIVTTNTEKDLECQISNQIKTTTTSIKNFGSTDCTCTSHLQHHSNFHRLLKYTLDAYITHADNIDLYLLK